MSRFERTKPHVTRLQSKLNTIALAAFATLLGANDLSHAMPRARGRPFQFGRTPSGAARAKREAARRRNIRKHPRGVA